MSIKSAVVGIYVSRQEAEEALQIFHKHGFGKKIFSFQRHSLKIFILDADVEKVSKNELFSHLNISRQTEKKYSALLKNGKSLLVAYGTPYEVKLAKEIIDHTRVSETNIHPA